MALIYFYNMLLFMRSVQVFQYHLIKSKFNLKYQLVGIVLCGMFNENKGELYIKRVYRFIRRYPEFRGLPFRLSFFGTKILKNDQYLIHCCFQMPFYPPVCHDFQENTKSTNLSEWNVFLPYGRNCNTIFSSASAEDLAVRKIFVDPDRLCFKFY